MLTATRSHSKQPNNKTTPRLTQIAALSGFEPMTLHILGRALHPLNLSPRDPVLWMESKLTELPPPLPPPLSSSPSSVYCHTLLPSDLIPHSISDFSCSISVSWLDVTGRAAHRERGRGVTPWCISHPCMALQLHTTTTNVNLKALGGRNITHEKGVLRGLPPNSVGEH